jgi:Short C-terminal domain
VQMDGAIGHPATNRLGELSELLESGLLTQAEFGEKRRDVLNSI